MSDHAGLAFKLKTGRTHDEAITKNKEVKRRKIEPDTPQEVRYKTLTKKTIKTWITTAKKVLKTKASKKLSRREIGNLIEKLTDQLKKDASTAAKHEQRKKPKGAKRNRDKTYLHINDTFIQAIQTTNTNLKTRREKWNTHAKRRKTQADKQIQASQVERNKIIELAENDEMKLWEHKKTIIPKIKPSTLPTHITTEKGEIWKKQDLLEYYRQQGEKMLTFENDEELSPEDATFQRITNETIHYLDRKARKMRSFVPNDKDTLNFLKYLQKASNKQTAKGLDDVSPDLFLQAHQSIWEATGMTY
jgi:hypothetical protein